MDKLKEEKNSLYLHIIGFEGKGKDKIVKYIRKDYHGSYYIETSRYFDISYNILTKDNKIDKEKLEEFNATLDDENKINISDIKTYRFSERRILFSDGRVQTKFK